MAHTFRRLRLPHGIAALFTEWRLHTHSYFPCAPSWFTWRQVDLHVLQLEPRAEVFAAGKDSELHQWKPLALHPDLRPNIICVESVVQQLGVAAVGAQQRHRAFTIRSILRKRSNSIVQLTLERSGGLLSMHVWVFSMPTSNC